MYDFLLRGSAKEPAIRFAFAGTTQLCNDGIIAHDCNPVSGAAFVEALSATALLAVLLEGNEKYSVKMDYTGEVGTILCDVNAAGYTRGLISNTSVQMDAPLDDIFGVDDAKVTIIKFEDGKVLNSGSTMCGMGSPADDMALFFSISDQIESEICTTCQFRPDPEHPVAYAKAFMLQAMPGCDLNIFSEIRERIHQPSFKKIMAQEELPFELLIKKLLKELDLNDLSYTLSETPQFKCSCSRESMKRALLTLGKMELEKLFATEHEAKLRCQYCNKSYSFDAEEFQL